MLQQGTVRSLQARWMPKRGLGIHLLIVTHCQGKPGLAAAVRGAGKNDGPRTTAGSCQACT